MTDYEYKVGDRIDCYHPDLIEQVRGRRATVTKIIEGGGVSALVDSIRNPTKDGYNFALRNIRPLVEEPSDEEIAALFKLKRETHFLHPEARDPEYDGMAALCDWMNCLNDAPHKATLSTASPEEVTCQDCLNFMSRLAYVWIDGGVDHEDFNRGATTKVPRNPYWGDGS